MWHKLKEQAPVFGYAFVALMQFYFWGAIIIVLFVALVIKKTSLTALRLVKNIFNFFRESYGHKFENDPEFETI